MKKIALLLLAIIYFFAINSMNLFGNTGEITGKLIDQENGIGLKGSRISALRLKDSMIVAGSITDYSGDFVIENLQIGDYFIKASFIGYKDYLSDPFKISESKKKIDMGMITLTLASYNSLEINVSGEKEAIQVGIDKKIINVDKFGASIGGTAIDILQNVPSVTVDIDGNVALRGSQNVQILIDGRPSGLTGSEILEQLPASSIETIELITNPAAKYDASGQAGIINIVLKKKMDDGLNGLMTINAGTGDKYNGSLNLNYRISDVNLYTNIDTRFFSMYGNGSMNQNSILSSNPDSLNLSFLNRYEDFRRQGNMNNIKIGTDFYFPLNYSASFSILYNFGKRNGGEFFTFNSGSSNQIQQNTFLRDVYGKRPTNTFDIAGSFRKIFDSKKHSLSLDYLYSVSIRDGSQDLLQRYIKDGTPYSMQKDSTLSDNKVLNIQLDYIKPFEGESKFEAGMKTSIRKVGMNYALWDFDSTSKDFKRNNFISNEFIYYENIIAGYVSYSVDIDDFAYQAGIRSEYTKVEGDQRTINKTFNKDYIDFFPSAFIRYDISKSNQIQISYTRRINRPSFRELNIFIDYEDPLNLESGNPDLNPEFVNSLEFTNDIKIASTNLISTLFYRQTEDVISDIKTLSDSGVTFTIPKNLISSKSVGAEFIIQQAITNSWKTDGSFSYFYSSYQGAPEYLGSKSDNYSWETRINNSVKLSKDIDFQFTVNFNGPEVQAQGTENEVYWADVSMKINVFDDAGTINLRVSDIFNTMQWGSTTYASNFSSESTHKRFSQVLYLGFTYKINDYKKPQQKPKGDVRDSEGDM